MDALAAPAAKAQEKKGKPKERLYTIEDYLAMEESSLKNHEFDNGKLIPVAGGTPMHSLTKAHLVTALNNKIYAAGKEHLVFNSDIRVYLPTFDKAVMPDATVVVGAADFYYVVPVGLLLNPTLIVEVLSKGTESYDRGEKFARYRTLPTLVEYVLVSQKEHRVETFVKQDGKWFLNEDSVGLDAMAELVSIGITISLADLYRHVALEQERKKKTHRQGKKP